MPKLMDVLLVVDVESTCWNGNPPSGQRSEIIEIGLCPINLKTLTRGEKQSILVSPVQSEISPFCTELTTLTPEMFSDAGPLSDAVARLKKEFHSKDRLWASWGDYDRIQFERNCRELNLKYPFGRGHLNVKTLFAAAMGSSREMGMGQAYRLLGEKMEGVHHRGDDDAWNIAGILCGLLKKMRTLAD